MAAFRPALVVVDFQEDFCPPNGSLAVTGGRDIAPVINKLLDLPFTVKIGTQDWHPPDHVSFASCHGPDARPFETTVTVVNPLNGDESETIRLWPDHCVQGTPGAELVPELDAAKLHHVVKKGQDKRVEMYSAFRDTYKAPCVYQSELARLLSDARVTHVYVVGLAKDVCVKYTAFHAAEDGFRTYILDDASRMVVREQDAVQRFLGELEPAGVTLTTSDGPEVGWVRQMQA